MSHVPSTPRNAHRRACALLACALALLAPPSGRAAIGADASIAAIDWRTSPLDLNLRGYNGARFRFRCPPGKPAAGAVVGSGPYADGSSICAAAVHAGALRPAQGGLVTIEVRPGQAHFAGSLSHYVQSESYDAFWNGTFVVITDAPPDAPPGARRPDGATLAPRRGDPARDTNARNSPNDTELES